MSDFMGETTYVMRPVVYTSIYSVREHPKESAIHAALSQSISFGRFMSESLSWEKWSTFTSNKYVEEAERFSQPGSVAEKTAFFEAHYKRMAPNKQTVANVGITSSSPRNTPKGKVEQDQEESNTKSSVLLEAMDNKRDQVTCLFKESEMKIESQNWVTDSYDDKNEKIGEKELNLNEPKSENKERKKSSEKSLLEETDTKVVESQHHKQESKWNEEHESESPSSDEYHSVKQDSVCGDLVGSINEDDYCSLTPIDEKIIVMESSHKKKSSGRWMKPLRDAPAKEFNFFSLTVKMKNNKSKTYAEATANGAPKYRKLTPESETRALKYHTAIVESKTNANGCSPSVAGFSQLWNKCRKKLLSSFRLKQEEKAGRKKEKVEKKPSKWGLTHCFKPSPYRKNYREKAKMEDQMKLVPKERILPY